jgi:hypothetical protein
VLTATSKTSATSRRETPDSTVSITRSRGDGSDPVKFGYRQGCDEVRAHFGGDDELAVWLALAGRELCEELVVGDARRGRQASVLEDAGANLLGGRQGGRQAAPVLRDIEIGLIESSTTEPWRFTTLC